jgi:RNA polymerase sigma factor (sigma-70 family)
MISQPRGPRASHHERVLLLAAQRGDPHAHAELVRRYEPLIQAVCAVQLLPVGCDPEDLAQEARIGVWRAIDAWQPGRGPFPALAARCVKNQVFKAMDRAGRHKHQMLSRADSLPADADLGSGHNAASTTALPPWTGRCDDPVTITLARERLQEIIAALQLLTGRERTVLAGSLSDKTWRQLADEHNCSVQAVHGALYRARLKLTTATGTVTSLPSPRVRRGRS